MKMHMVLLCSVDHIIGQYKLFACYITEFIIDFKLIFCSPSKVGVLSQTRIMTVACLSNMKHLHSIIRRY